MNAQSAADEKCRQVALLVDAIEQELRLLALWSEEPAPITAMASRTPFCFDTLKLWQWLQWILVPRIRLILADGAALPTTSEIAPLAEVEFRRLSQDSSHLLELIREFDRVITSPP
jgi:uncharacterized protein YqcC (DUF446 family)